MTQIEVMKVILTLEKVKKIYPAGRKMKNKTHKNITRDILPGIDPKIVDHVNKMIDRPEPWMPTFSPKLGEPTNRRLYSRTSIYLLSSRFMCKRAVRNCDRLTGIQHQSECSWNCQCGAALHGDNRLPAARTFYGNSFL